MRVHITQQYERRLKSAHHLPGYQGKCSMVHGHEWRVQVELNYVTSVAELEAHGGMLYDFAKISKVFAHLDHDDLNEYVHFPTAEMISIYVGKLVARELMIDPGSVLVTVWEDEESSVTTIILSNNGEEYDED